MKEDKSNLQHEVTIKTPDGSSYGAKIPEEISAKDFLSEFIQFLGFEDNEIWIIEAVFENGSTKRISGEEIITKELEMGKKLKYFAIYPLAVAG